jgi:tetratricopeptide (TPR) repeat protein
VAGDNDSLTSNSIQRPAQLKEDRAGEDADALYAQGMAHYRRREWERAKTCFSRLKAIAPDRRGVDALLNEVDIFIQLQGMQPERQGTPAPAGTVEEAQVQWAETAPPRRTAARSIARRRIPWRAILIALAVLTVVLVVILRPDIFETISDNQRQARVGALINQGRAAINVGDCARAAQAFGEALALAPKNEDVQLWEKRALRCQQLISLYAQAEADIEAGQWDSALEKLNQITELDPTYRDASEKVDFVRSQQALDVFLIEAKDHLEQGNWNEAIRILEQLREQAPGFQTREVQQSLFDAYFRNGVELMAAAGDSPDVMGQAIQSFELALSILPNDQTALEEREFADLYRQGYLSYNQEDWPTAVDALRELYDSRPDYMDGRGRSLLCTSYLRLGDAYQGAGDVTSLEQALTQYQEVLAIDGCDHVEAAVKEREVYATLHPPTPTPTSTPKPTSTPLPTPTWTATLPPPTSPPPPAKKTPVPTVGPTR